MQMQKECYGKFDLNRQECRRCRVRDYCRRAKAEDRLLSRASFADVDVERLPAAPEQVEDEVPAAGKSYSREELIRLTRFFLDLSPTQFVLLKLRIDRPDLTIKEIAAAIPVSTYSGGAFYRRMVKEHPALADLLQR